MFASRIWSYFSSRREGVRRNARAIHNLGPIAFPSFEAVAEILGTEEVHRR